MNRPRQGLGRIGRTAVRQARRGVRRGVRVARRHPLVGRVLRPTVSVVLPVYDVEQYLPHCLDSLAGQTFRDYELIVVDDGSPDGSRAIAERYAAADPRIRVVVRENGGLGAARNTGVREARGRFLTFVDSDDALPPEALAVLVATALRSGSDIVVGSVSRFDSEREWTPEWTARVHDQERVGIRAEDFLPVLRNLYTWNKLFSRRFFTAQDLWFREGVAYEDQPIITQLLDRARAIDIVPDVVYHYRARDDRSSISQQTSTVKDLQARIEAWRVTKETLRRETSKALYDGWLLTLFDSHFHWYINSPGTADQEYWELLRTAVDELVADATPEIWRGTTPAKRVIIELVRQGRRDDVLEFVRVEGRRLDKWPSTVLPGEGVLLQLPYQGTPELDDSLFVLRPEQLSMAHSVENVHWVDAGGGRGTCRISGWAYLTKIDQAVHASQVSVLLRDADGTERRFGSLGRPETAFPPPVEDHWCDYRPGAFEVELPLGEVLRAAAGGSVDVLLEVTAAGFTVVRPVRALLRSGSAGFIPSADLGGGDRVAALWRYGSPLSFRLERLEVEAVSLAVSGRELSGVLSGPDVESLRSVVVQNDGTSATAPVTDRPDGTRVFAVTLPAPAQEPVPGRSTVWALSGRTADDAPLAITSRGAMGTLTESRTGTGAVVLERNRSLRIDVSEWGHGATAERVGLGPDDVVTVSGRAYGPGITAMRLTTRHKKCRAEGAVVPVTDGGFEAQVKLRHDVYRFGAQLLPVGDHELQAELYGAPGDEPVLVSVRMSARINGDLPIGVHTEHMEGRIIRGPGNGVRMSLVRPVGADRGAYQQNQLKARPTATRLHRGVLMRAYFGEHATDNGIAIQRELERRGADLPVYWAVQDYSVPVPDGGIPVVVNTREFHDLLGSAAYYVDNMYQPEFHKKPEGQVVVQTFHGYPFKQMGHPHWQNLQFSRARIESYDRRAAQWDYLVSPARYATPLLTEHFAYPGEVLEIGYPRNDVLQGPDAEAIRAATRAALHIEDGQTVVLHAPTFRDYLSTNDSSAAFADFFDYGQAHDALGDDVVILARGHAFNARSRGRVGRLPGVIDVTDYPEVSDLYLAADAAVVDYSSLRFDFAVTGKPMVFLVPDLGLYQDTRGWLMPFEETAPGPLVDTTAEVVAHLSDLAALREGWAAPYERFRQTYLDLEDGHAARRFVDRVFVPRGDAPEGW